MQREQNETPQSVQPIEWLTHPDADMLAHLPPLPVSLDYSDGVIKITEKRQLTTGLITRSLRPLYEPMLLSEEREQELNMVATTLGYTDIAELARIPFDQSVLSETASPYLMRHIPEEATMLDALREMRRAALENEYVTRAIELARGVLQEKVPELCPEQSTIALTNPRQAALATYYGRFGGNHLMSFRAGEITRDDIDALDSSSDTVMTAAHELIHQKHTEVQDMNMPYVDVPDYAPFEGIRTQDPWEALRISEEYWQDFDVTSDVSELRHRLCGCLTEAIAHLGEAEVSGELDDMRMVIGEQANAWEGRPADEHLWVKTFADMAPLGERVGIILALMQVEIRRFSDMSEDDLTQIMKNPALILEV